MKEEGKESPNKKHGKHRSHKEKVEELEKRLNKEIEPFTLADLPLSDRGEEDLLGKRYLYQKVLGAGSYGVVIAAVDRIHLEQCAVTVTFEF